MSQTKTIKYLILSIIILAGLFFVVDSVQAIWYNSSWDYRREIIIDPTKIDDDLTNFPVLVKFTTSTVPVAKSRDDGYDMRFTQSDGETLLDYEREFHASTTNTYIYWVRLPTVSSSTAATTTFYMYYGNSSAGDGAAATSTWDDDYVLVQHMDEDPSTDDQIDSTFYGNHGTSSGAMTSADLISGQIGKALDFDGSNDKIVVADADELTTANGFTNEVWVDLTADAGGIFNRRVGGVCNEWNDYVDSNLTNKIDLNVIDNTEGGSIGRRCTAAECDIDEVGWAYVVYTWDGGTTAASLGIWVDGVQRDNVDAGSGSFVAMRNTNCDFVVANYYSATYWLLAAMDEIRLSKIDRGGAYIKASYNSGNDSLLTYGAEEDVSTYDDPLVFTQSTTIYRSATSSLKISGTGSTTTIKMVAASGVKVTLTAYLRTEGYPTTGRVQPGIGLEGLGMSASSSMTTTSNDVWELVTVSATPTSAGIATIKIWGAADAADDYLYIDDMTAVQSGISIDTGQFYYWVNANLPGEYVYDSGNVGTMDTGEFYYWESAGVPARYIFAMAGAPPGIPSGKIRINTGNIKIDKGRMRID